LGKIKRLETELTELKNTVQHQSILKVNKVNHELHSFEFNASSSFGDF